jgi:hypothetical protein
MTKRSYYLTRDLADRLATAVDDMHFATRAPKHEVLAAIIAVGLADLKPIEAQLRARQGPPG